ncbi:MAG: hypothetical protein CMM93_07555 [Rickettsiales bacterium]|nr:hypothetical protein [Rickettsiales bacterium]|tara:strand:+ start:520 stop:735 length:216 start_codon:yes stop_codon:yes gene_type:complete
MVKIDPITQMQQQLAYQELEIIKLSEELYAQQKETALLKRQVQHLIDKWRELQQQAQDNADLSPEPPPPHY